jgi:superfamily II DNA or RNA helicase
MRPYQKEAIAAVRGEFGKGAKSTLVTLPTGAGKTVLFAELCRLVLPKRTLIIVHRDELLNQAARKIEDIAGLVPGIEQGRRRSLPDDSVVVASIQSLARGRVLSGPPFALCVIDEAHHAPAASYRNTIERLAPRYLLGVTATPFREDKLALSDLFETDAYSKTLFDLIKDGWLCNVMVRTLPVGIDLSGVRIAKRDFSEADIAAALEPMIEALAQIIASDYSDRKLLTFCPLRETSMRWTKALQSHGLAAAHIAGDSVDRKEILAAFNANDIRFLSNASLLTEGYDEPSIDTVLILRPTKSRVLYSQMIGRGTRLFEGKPHLTVLDPLFLSERHNVLSVADIVAKTKEEANDIEELMEDGGLDLSEAVQTVAQSRKASLVKKLQLKSRRRGYEASLAELALSLNDGALEGWSPVVHWHNDRATAHQLAVIAKAGVNPALISCKGLASAVIERISDRRRKGLATLKQVRYLRELGHPCPEMASFAEASDWIGREKRAG